MASLLASCRHQCHDKSICGHTCCKRQATLCDACFEVLKDSVDGLWHTEEDGTRHFTTKSRHNDIELIEKAAKDGCYICQVLNDYPFRKWKERPYDCEARLTAPKDHTPWYRLTFAVKKFNERVRRPGPSSRDSAVTRYFVLQQEDTYAAMLGAKCARSTFTADEAHFSLARHWLRKCSRMHKSCVSNDKPLWYPRRLLLIGTETVRLLRTAEQTLTDPYATVSYRWGSRPFEFLTTENLSMFEIGFARHDLLPGLRDAIQIVSQLGIDYVWIDSLCIIQSSASGCPDITPEKLAEIASMDQVYSNAILNVAGVHCSGPQESLFVHRPPLTSPSRQIVWRSKHDSLARTYSIREDFTDCHPDSQSLRWSSQPLAKRAWVMQERLLAPRMLYFTDSMLFWECTELEASELRPEGSPERRDVGAKYMPSEPFDLHQYNASARYLWAGIIRSYSGKNLTFPVQDKLLALSAIAAQAAMKFQDTYVVGCFRRDLLYYLCWERSFADVDWKPGDRTFYGKPWKYPESTELPSWSWITLDGPVEYRPFMNYGTFEPVVSITDIKVELKDPRNPFGAIKSAALSLDGRLFKVCHVTLESGSRERDVTTCMQIAGVRTWATTHALFWSMEHFQSIRDQLLFLPIFWAPKNHFPCSYLKRYTVKEVLDTTQENRDSMLEQYSLHGLLLTRRSDGNFERFHLLTEVSARLIFEWAEQTAERVVLV